MSVVLAALYTAGLLGAALAVVQWWPQRRTEPAEPRKEPALV